MRTTSQRGTTVSRIISALLAALAAAWLAPSAALAADAGDSAYYYDGGRKISIVRQPDLVAEFDTARRTRQSANTQAVRRQPMVADRMAGIYRVADISAETAASGAADRSPVYRQGGTPAGRLMALPGGVLVKFKPDWRAEQVNTWLAERGLPPGQALAIGPGWYLVPTAAGAAALDTANGLEESGVVLSASPNWWTPAAPR